MVATIEEEEKNRDLFFRIFHQEYKLNWKEKMFLSFDIRLSQMMNILMQHQVWIHTDYVKIA